MNSVRIFLLIFISLNTVGSYSQISTNSPYSRFGIGDLNINTFAEQNSLGGNSVVYYNENIINPNNAATYSKIRRKSFLLSTGLNSEYNNFFTDEVSQREYNSSFSHITLAFPLSKRLYFSSGLLPYSSVGYNIEYDSLYENFEDTISISSSGNGGLSKYYMGSSIRINNIISIGANASYYFGALSNSEMLDFNNLEIFNVNSVNRINIKGFSLETSLLITAPISENQKFSLGLTYQGSSNLFAKNTLVGTTFKNNSSSTISIKDTFENAIYDGKLNMPSKLSMGLMYESKQWLFVVNYFSQEWSDYSIVFQEKQEDFLENSNSISAGIQYVPNRKSVNRYWETINYRFGGSYSKDYLEINNYQLNERSVTVGLGLPLYKSNTFYNFSLQFGDRGTTEDNLIKEQFLRYTLGVTFKGNWFIKRKYD